MVINETGGSQIKREATMTGAPSMQRMMQHVTQEWDRINQIT